MPRTSGHHIPLLVTAPEFGWINAYTVASEIGDIERWRTGFCFSSIAIAPSVIAILVAVLLGTVIDLPTAGEIPLVLALAAGGLATGAIGALLITLPAFSIVTLTMLAPSHGVRTTVAAGAAVAATGLMGRRGARAAHGLTRAADRHAPAPCPQRRADRWPSPARSPMTTADPLSTRAAWREAASV